MLLLKVSRLCEFCAVVSVCCGAEAIGDDGLDWEMVRVGETGGEGVRGDTSFTSCRWEVRGEESSVSGGGDVDGVVVEGAV